MLIAYSLFVYYTYAYGLFVNLCFRECFFDKYIKPATNKKSLIDDIGYNKLFITFIFACFLGTVLETIWCYLTRGTIESRAGLIYGPFNLIYGFGALLMLFLLYNFKRNWTVFLGSALIGGAFEYICSVFQELSFGTVSWNYVKTPALSLNGRTNYAYMVFWGALGVCFIRVLFPAFNNGMDACLEKISPKVEKIIVTGLAIFMIINSILSFAAVWRQAARRDGKAATNVVTRFLDRTYDDERLRQIFPNMQLVTKDGTENLWGNDESEKIMG